MQSSVAVAPIGTFRVSKHFIPAHGLLPNSSIVNKPLLIYHSVFHRGASSVSVESYLTSVGAVLPQWRYSMYPTTHFHSTTHEVLCVTSGRAKLCFGGEDNPNRVEPTVEAGDVMVLPAGVAHRLLEDLSGSRGGFEMVGSYPKGCCWDMCYGEAGEIEKVKSISTLPWFQKDPIFGDHGPVFDL